MSNRKFGVEFELNGISERRAYELLKKADIPVRSDDYWEENSNCWEIKEDGSVNDGFEIASPILSGERGLAQAKKIARILTAAGARVDTSCGFHVHVDARDLSAKSIINVAIRYGKFENEIDSFMPHGRRNSHFAQSVKRLIEPSDIPDLLRNEEYKYFDRYHKVNLAAYAEHGTIEFRQHAGTLNPSKVEKWVRFCVEFVEASIVNDKPTSGKLKRLLRQIDYGRAFSKKELSQLGFSKSFVNEACEKFKDLGYEINHYDRYYDRANKDNWDLIELSEDETLPLVKRDSLFRGVSMSVRRHLRRRVGTIEREESMLRRNSARATDRMQRRYGSYGYSSYYSDAYGDD